MTKPQKTRKPGRPPAASTDVPTSDQILLVAARMFMGQGFEAVSMGQVASECGITKAMVYYYFSSKANLFIAAMVQTMERVRQRTVDILNRDEPLYDKLLTIMQTRLRIDTPLDFNVIMRSGQSVLSKEQLETIHQAEERLLESVADAFRAAIASGELREVDALLCARIYMSLLLVGKAELAKPLQETLDVETQSKQLMDFMWKGVASQDAK